MADHDNTERPANGWTNRSIYELLTEIDKRYASEFRAVRELIANGDRRYEQRFADSDKAVSAALAAQKEATTKAEIAAEKRFDALAQTFTEKIDSLAESRATGAGWQRGVSGTWAAVVGVFVVAGVIVTAILALSARLLPVAPTVNP